MAVNTRDKRFSIIGMGSSVELPVPQKALNTYDRAQLLELYAGRNLSPPKTTTILMSSPRHGLLILYGGIL